MVRRTVAELGGLDLVNNAGIQYIATLLETTDEQWERIFAVNVRASWLCAKAVAEYLIQRGKGGRPRSRKRPLHAPTCGTAHLE